jgi:hypothetical protein
VQAFSSGNFGQGLAAACMLQRIRCTIVMPGDAPESKEARARSYGAQVVRSEVVDGVNREVTAAELASEVSARQSPVWLAGPQPRRLEVVANGLASPAPAVCFCVQQLRAWSLRCVPTWPPDLSPSFRLRAPTAPRCCTPSTTLR